MKCIVRLVTEWQVDLAESTFTELSNSSKLLRAYSYVLENDATIPDKTHTHVEIVGNAVLDSDQPRFRR